MRQSIRRHAAITKARHLGAAAALIVCSLAHAPHAAEPDAAPLRLSFLGMVEIPSGTRFQGTTIGGLSGAVALPDGGYLVVSDDREGGPDGTPRLYALSIDLADGSLDAGDVTVTATHPLLTAEGATLDALEPDPEGIVIDRDGRLWIASERDSAGRPAIMGFDDLTMTAALDVPAHHMPGAGQGVRVNKGFESLTLGPDGATLWAAHESALVQDGPDATLEAGPRVRVLRYRLAGGTARLEGEFAYDVEPVAQAPWPAWNYTDSGLVELLARPDGALLALERSFSAGSPGVGFTVRLFHVDPTPATAIDQTGAAAATPMAKTLLLDFADLGIAPDNLEALATGPLLPDGRETLIVISDDNFAAFGTRSTQIIALAID
ncbi:MAG: esterase-like activity of phytase family protein [Pseudomonadota bacterium]